MPFSWLLNIFDLYYMFVDTYLIRLLGLLYVTIVSVRIHVN